MERLFHMPREFREKLSPQREDFDKSFVPATTLVDCPEPTRFRYLFPQLHKNPSNFLDPSKETVHWLQQLGMSMCDKSHTPIQSAIPSAYTYFGQFIVHDVSFVPNTGITLLKNDVTPMPFTVVNNLPNPRTGLLDLDSVYGPIIDSGSCSKVPVKEEMTMVVDRAVFSDVDGTDIPRTSKVPHSPMIGDRRNDENLITSQLHLAWLRAHNLVVKAGASFQQAQTLLRHRYQYLIVNDYLPKLIPTEYIERAKEFGHLYSPPVDDFFLPIEFSAACFRFGHSMIRSSYNYNKRHKLSKLTDLFMPNAIGKWHNILDEWIIDWKEFLPNGQNRALSFHPMIVEPLSTFLQKTGNPFLSLAVRDLLRGYQLNLPTGQAVAKALNLQSLTDTQIEDLAISDFQRSVLQKSGFSKRTPLWFYLFAEATHHVNGGKLGPVCGQLVAMVLLEVAKRSQTNLSDEDWDPILGPKTGFDLGQFLHHVSPS